MRYKLIDYVSDWHETIISGTCELCYHTEEYDEGYFVLEDENGQLIQVNLLEPDYSDFYAEYESYDNITVDNVVDFAAWLSQQDLPILTEENIFNEIYNAVERYKKGK